MCLLQKLILTDEDGSWYVLVVSGGALFSFSLLFSFCFYVGPPPLLQVFLLTVVALVVVLPVVLQSIGFHLAGLPSAELQSTNLHSADFQLCPGLSTVILS